MVARKAEREAQPAEPSRWPAPGCLCCPIASHEEPHFSFGRRMATRWCVKAAVARLGRVSGLHRVSRGPHVALAPRASHSLAATDGSPVRLVRPSPASVGGAVSRPPRALDLVSSLLHLVVSPRDRGTGSTRAAERGIAAALQSRGNYKLVRVLETLGTAIGGKSLGLLRADWKPVKVHSPTNREVDLGCTMVPGGKRKRSALTVSRMADRPCRVRGRRDGPLGTWIVPA